MKPISAIFKSSTIKDSLITGIGLSTTALIGFIYTVILARTLGPETYGIYSAITALSTIIFSLGDLGISSSLINFIPKRPKSRQIIINTTFTLQLIIALFGLLLFCLFALFHQQIIPGSLRIHLFLAGVISANYLFLSFAQGLFSSERRFWSYSLSQIIDPIVKISLVLLLLYFSRLDISTAIFSNIVSTFFALFITLNKDLRKISLNVDRSFLSEMYRFARWIAAAKIFSVFISRIDVILLNILAGSFAAGIYSAANRITLLFALLIGMLNSVVSPRFSKYKSIKEATPYIKKLLILITGISLVVLSTALFAKPIILLVFGQSYSQAITVFQLTTISMIPFLYSLALTPAIIYTINEPQKLTLLTGLQVALVVLLEVILIPKISFLAPVVANGIANLCLVFGAFIILKSKNVKTSLD